MFTEPRINVIESDEGFSVEVLGMTGLRYESGGASIFVDSEVLAGSASIAVYSYRIDRWDDGRLAGEEERTEIIDNIRRAFEYKGVRIDVT